MDCKPVIPVSLENVSVISKVTDMYNQTQNERFMMSLELFLYSKVVTLICILGLIGNAMNLAVLTRRRLKAGMTTTERTVFLGLAALATSDMMFCACVLPHAWVPPHRFYFTNAGFYLYYTLYSDAVINIFVMCSTWLTVAMATSRFVAICYPLKVRSLINGCRARLSIGSILLLCVIVNLPRFWNEAIDTMDCAGGWSVYFRSMGYIRRNTRLLYISVYFLVATVLPFLILLFCNIRLVRALRKSLGFRLPVKGVSSASQADTHRITLTLVVIVVMYMILVLPVEVSNFVRDTVIYTPSMTQSYNLLLAFLNTMQVSNFAFHFVLYCVVNVHFRHSMKTIFVCERERRSTRLALTEYDQAIALTTQWGCNGRHSILSPTGCNHRDQRTNISHSETVGREGRTRFLSQNVAFASFDIISSF